MSAGPNQTMDPLIQMLSALGLNQLGNQYQQFATQFAQNPQQAIQVTPQDIARLEPLAIGASTGIEGEPPEPPPSQLVKPTRVTPSFARLKANIGKFGKKAATVAEEAATEVLPTTTGR